MRPSLRFPECPDLGVKRTLADIRDWSEIIRELRMENSRVGGYEGNRFADRLVTIRSQVRLAELQWATLANNLVYLPRLGGVLAMVLDELAALGRPQRSGQFEHPFHQTSVFRHDGVHLLTFRGSKLLLIDQKTI